MNIALGVGGGIAAYKAAELARALMTRGFTVNEVTTSSPYRAPTVREGTA